MTGIKFDESLQPVLNSSNDFEEVDGREQFEQIIRFKSIDRLYGILSEYDDDEVPNKITMEISRIASSSELIDDIESVEINKNEAENSYKVVVRYSQSEDFQFQLSQL